VGIPNNTTGISSGSFPNFCQVLSARKSLGTWIMDNGYYTKHPYVRSLSANTTHAQHCCFIAIRKTSNAYIASIAA